MALRLATRSGEDAGPAPPRLLYRATQTPPQRATPARARVLKAAEGGLAFTKKALAEAAGCSASVIDALLDEGALETLAAPPPPVVAPLDPAFAHQSLEPAQEDAAAALREAVFARGYRPFLLEGVTGSGKTEVYFEAVAERLRAAARRSC